MSNIRTTITLDGINMSDVPVGARLKIVEKNTDKEWEARVYRVKNKSTQEDYDESISETQLEAEPEGRLIPPAQR